MRRASWALGIVVILGWGRAWAQSDAGTDPDGGVPSLDGGGTQDGTQYDPLDYPDEYRSPIRFEYTDNLADICGLDIDSGWVPDGSPIQVRFQFHLGCGYYVVMNGYAVLKWPPRPGPYLSFRGIPRGGRYELDYSVRMSARVKISIHEGGLDIEEEFDLPYIPDFNIGVYATKRFTPFLLEGNPERPLVVEDQIPHTRLFRYDLMNLLEASGAIPPQDLVEAWLEVYIDGYVGSRFEGRKITVAVGEQNTEFPIPDLVFTREGHSEHLPVSPDEMVGGTRDATYEAAVVHYAHISFYPHIKIEVAGYDVFEMDLFEIPIPIDDKEDYWVFEPAVFDFAFPDIEAPQRVFVPPANIDSQSMAEIQVVNEGGETLRGEARIDPPFYLPPNLRFELEPGQSTVIPIYFVPTTIGPVRKFLTLYSNDPDESPRVVVVDSYGCSPDGDCAIPEDMKRVCEVADSGCGCTSARGQGPAALALVLFLGVWWRRRRQRLH